MTENYQFSSTSNPRDVSPLRETSVSGFGNRSRLASRQETDKRIEEIKRKYDTPNRREKLTAQFGSGKKAQFVSSRNQDIRNKENFDSGSGYRVSESSSNKYSLGRDYTSKSILKASSRNINSSGVRDHQPADRENTFKKSKREHSGLQSDFRADASHSRGDPEENIQRRYETNSSIKKEEEEFFRKVKEMKQSLLYSESTYLRDSAFCHSKPKNQHQGEFSKGSLKTESGTEFQREGKGSRRYYDSRMPVERDRIDNIDKINQKIKGILDCLNENEKNRTEKQFFPQRERASSKLYDQNSHKRSEFSRLHDSRSVTQGRSNLSHSIIEGLESRNISRQRETQQRFCHRQEKSELLQKIEITQPKRTPEDEEKWERLSSKLEKYEAQNKLRIEQALGRSQNIGSSATPKSEIVDSGTFKSSAHKEEERRNINTRSFYQPSTAQVRKDTKSIDISKNICTRSFVGDSCTKARDMSVQPKQNRNYELQRSGKKLNEEIDKLQLKIRQFEEQKKKMNISFKPFTFSNSKSVVALPIAGSQTRKFEASEFSDRKNSECGKITKSASKKVLNFDRLSQDNASNLKGPQSLIRNDSLLNIEAQREPTRGNDDKDYSFEKSDQQNLQISLEKAQNFASKQSQEGIVEVKQQQSSRSSARTSKFISQMSSKLSNEGSEEQESYAVELTTKEQIQDRKNNRVTVDRNEACFYDEDELRRKADDGIKQRKRILMAGANFDRPAKTELKRLVQELTAQVQLDEELRNGKIWLESADSVPEKEQKLLSILKEQSGKELTLEKVKELFKVRESENNPFFTAQGYDYSVQQLAAIYVRAEEHWRSNLKHKFNRAHLSEQGFTSREIDLQRKGYINLEDLVRFLNLESGTFYRNRDLALVFIRLCEVEGKEAVTTFDNILDNFCQ